ncbi:aryl-sulfate sulfotransferase [Shewanella youngdeokensis]|uniref:Aryl-sulfate sulfotransferase n=1 Tax=Shewanella youngdeokensis TaxID=2999068 RepID=A0ABZ0JX76_9GAMM|nr:aryl-sulfate sulfotransferase [Shewanella sp. DAU334]
MFKKSQLYIGLFVICSGLSGVSINALADGGGSLAAKKMLAASTAQGQLGAIDVNPYGNAPLTAVIDLAGKHITDVEVTVHGKGENGVNINYPVDSETLQTHDGVPLFGLYANYRNNITVSYKLDGKKIVEKYKLQTGGISTKYNELMVRPFPEVEPITVAKGFEDRLYWINSQTSNRYHKDIKWANGGSLDWNYQSVNYITDTNGDIRWILDDSSFTDDQNIMGRGFIMGVHQVSNGEIIFGKGQKYYRMDLLGRMIKSLPLPRGYSDFSHEIREMDNGHYLIRAAKRNYVKPSGEIVTTVRDHILEVDQSGNLVEVWDLNTILDPMRDTLLVALDAGAVCLNVDDTLSGKKVKIEPDMPYGDIPGVGAGRNWAHVNSIDYDEKDDTIIISPRHQATAIKIGRDKKVKWILGAPDGWTGELATKVLQPVDSKGNDISCTLGKCDGDFDWGWTQHTSWLNKEKNTLTVFDNGDGRGFEQPAIPSMKYSRAVEYKINEDDMTVEQVWEYGKERGYDWFSAITSVTNYEADKDTMFIFSASAGLFNKDWTKPVLNEIKYGTDEVMVELQIHNAGPREPSYRALVIKPEKAFH